MIASRACEPEGAPLTRVDLASNDQLAKTVGQVGLLGGSLNGPVSSLKGTAPLSSVGSVAANVSSSATAVVNNLLGSGPAVSVSSSTQLLSLLSNAAPSSGGTITITPAVVNAGANVAVAPTGAVSVGAAGGTVSAAIPSTGNILRTTLSGTGTGTLPGQGVLGPSPGH